MTVQLVKLLIYCVFNQINERVGALFYALTQLVMVHGNWPKPRDGVVAEIRHGSRYVYTEIKIAIIF